MLQKKWLGWGSLLPDGVLPVWQQRVKSWKQTIKIDNQKVDGNSSRKDIREQQPIREEEGKGSVCILCYVFITVAKFRSKDCCFKCEMKVCVFILSHANLLLRSREKEACRLEVAWICHFVILLFICSLLIFGEFDSLIYVWKSEKGFKTKICCFCF